MKKTISVFLILLAISMKANSQINFETDVIETPKGKLTLHFIGHGTLMLDFNGTIIHIDPWSKLADYTKLPKADFILVTHHHGDHLDSAAIASITKKNSQLIVSKPVFESLKSGIVLNNGDIKTLAGITIEATPAYNSTPGRDKFHPKGRDNGYVITMANKRVYIAGDTENIPEMAALKNIDIAFLPMNQPYTMLPEQVVASVEMFNPKILYPYHYGETDLTKLTELMAKYPNTEVRIRKME